MNKYCFAVAFMLFAGCDIPTPSSDLFKAMQRQQKTYESAILAAAENGYLKGRTYELLSQAGKDNSDFTLEKTTNWVAHHFHIGTP